MKKTTFLIVYMPIYIGVLYIFADTLFRLPILWVVSVLSTHSIPLVRTYSELLYYFVLCADIISFLWACAVFIMLLREVIDRLSNDQLSNTFRSIKETILLHRFLKRYPDNSSSVENPSGTSNNSRVVKTINRAVSKSLIDIRRSKVHIIIKLPRSQQAQAILYDLKDQIREQLASQMPDYVFSNITREKNILWIEGTRKQ